MTDTLSQSEEAIIDREHAVQLGMIDLLSDAIAENKLNREKLEILEQLVSYTEVHFMSEQLIMRQHSYDGFEAHESEHDILMDQLHNIKDEVTQKAVYVDKRALKELRRLLLTHIATQDRLLSDYLATR